MDAKFKEIKNKFGWELETTENDTTQLTSPKKSLSEYKSYNLKKAKKLVGGLTEN